MNLIMRIYGSHLGRQPIYDGVTSSAAEDVSDQQPPYPLMRALDGWHKQKLVSCLTLLHTPWHCICYNLRSQLQQHQSLVLMTQLERAEFARIMIGCQ